MASQPPEVPDDLPEDIPPDDPSPAKPDIPENYQTAPLISMIRKTP